MGRLEELIMARERAQYRVVSDGKGGWRKPVEVAIEPAAPSLPPGDAVEEPPARSRMVKAQWAKLSPAERLARNWRLIEAAKAQKGRKRVPRS